MEEQKGVAGMLTKALYVPYTSIALMGLIGVIGISSGLVSYGGERDQPTQAQRVDTALPAMKGNGFKANKYDNSSLVSVENAEDSMALAEWGKNGQAKPMTASLEEKTAAQRDKWFGSNEDLPIDQLASGHRNWKSRDQVRAHYNRQLDAQTSTNQQIIEQITAPAALSEEEQAERRSREEALERASRMENLAVSQLEMLQNQQPETAARADVSVATPTGETGNTALAPLPTSSANSATSQRPIASAAATVTLANLDEYVEIPSGNRSMNAFYGLKGERKTPEMVAAKPVPNAIEAVIHGDADNVTLVTGSTVKLRLLQDILVGQYLLPRHTILTGECAIGGERIQVLITTVRIQSSIIPVKLRAYDLDGHPGLYVPNLAVKNQISQTSSQAVTSGGMQMPYMVPTGANIGEMVVGQTAAQGVNVAMNGLKSLTSKKMGQVRVTIRPNHRVYLKPDQN